jgi:tRNA pseudouridine55 synthase
MITSEDVLNLAMEFTGPMKQVPPIHSAKKIDGQRAYDKARKGHEFEINPVEITIHEFEVTALRLPEIDFRIMCSKGTYIRSIAFDFGKRLGAGGYLSALRRTRIGDYKVEEAVSPSEFLLQLAEEQNLN